MSQHTQIQQTAEQQAAHAPQFASTLIVDDQRFDRSRLKKLCSQLAFTTHVAEADSLCALRDRLKKDRFDLVLLDYHLTDSTGIEGVEIIRADAVNRDAATVMITGTQERDITVQALKMGMSDYLTKDELGPETLARAAITALQKAQLARLALTGAAPRHLPPAPCPLTADSVADFSGDCAQDIKPSLSRMMRQMRELRDPGRLDPEDAALRIERVEGSLRRLWAFLEELDELGARDITAMPNISTVRGTGPLAPFSGINMRVPSERPTRPAGTPVKPPSVFRRRPD